MKTFGLASALLTQTSKGLIFHKEYKFMEYLEGGIKLLSAVSRLRGIFREVYKCLRR